MALPNLGALRLRAVAPTAEFYELDEAQANRLNETASEPITFADYESGWTFRVLRSTWAPGEDDEQIPYKDTESLKSYTYYDAESYWKWISVEGRGNPDGSNMMPWLQDFVILHDTYAKGEPLPGWVMQLPLRPGPAEPITVTRPSGTLVTYQPVHGDIPHLKKTVNPDTKDVTYFERIDGRDRRTVSETAEGTVYRWKYHYSGAAKGKNTVDRIEYPNGDVHFKQVVQSGKYEGHDVLAEVHKSNGDVVFYEIVDSGPVEDGEAVRVRRVAELVDGKLRSVRQRADWK